MSMPYKRVPLIVFLLCAEALVLAAQPRHFLVGFRAGTPDAQADATIAQAQGHVLKKIPQIRIHVIELPATADENALLNRLKKDRKSVV